MERNFIDLSSSRHVIDLSRLIKILNSDLQIFNIISQTGSQLTWTSSYVGMFKIHVLGCGFEINISHIWLPWFYGEFGGISMFNNTWTSVYKITILVFIAATFVSAQFSIIILRTLFRTVRAICATWTCWNIEGISDYRMVCSFKVEIRNFTVFTYQYIFP